MSLQSFDNDRPLTARSVMASALLGERPPELPVRQLIRIGSLFGLTENRSRVALSRMVANNELTTHGGTYRLHSPALLRRQERQRASVSGVTLPWDGSWLLVVLTAPATTAPERLQRRSTLTKARLAEQRDGVWLRPDNLGDQLRAELSTLDGDLQYFVAQPETRAHELAAQLWPLDEWASRANQLMGRLEDVPARTDHDLAPGFVLSASVLRHLQADPLLPQETLPRSWPGQRLRSQYETWNERYRRLIGGLATASNEPTVHTPRR
jgi:phenylacetic acid degradation operon negative regulatory protein